MNLHCLTKLNSQFAKVFDSIIYDGSLVLSNQNDVVNFKSSIHSDAPELFEMLASNFSNDEKINYIFSSEVHPDAKCSYKVSPNLVVSFFSELL